MKEQIKDLICQELNQAKSKNPPFSSSHEGWAVLLEEIEELTTEINHIKQVNEQLWNHVRINDAQGQQEAVDKIYLTAINTVCEAIQVAAMALKFSEMLKG